MTTLVMELQADSAASLSVAKLLLANCILELGGPAPVDDAVPWDPFAVDDSILFRVVIVNDSNIAFAPNTPYANLQRRIMCLPLSTVSYTSTSSSSSYQHRPSKFYSGLVAISYILLCSQRHYFFYSLL
jgi:hypothetical protein